MINVLFVCIGNSCRSQMAEGFARTYGRDVMHAWSAGLAPAPIVQAETIDAMKAKNIDITEQFPKSVDELELDAFDVVVNMSGLPIPTEVRGEVRIWNVDDPMKQSEEIYLRVRDQIEELVVKLILELRRMQRGKTPSVPARNPAPTSPVSLAKDDLRQANQSSQRFGFGRIRRARD